MWRDTDPLKGCPEILPQGLDVDWIIITLVELPKRLRMLALILLAKVVEAEYRLHTTSTCSDSLLASPRFLQRIPEAIDDLIDVTS